MYGHIDGPMVSQERPSRASPGWSPTARYHFVGVSNQAPGGWSELPRALAERRKAAAGYEELEHGHS